MDVHVLKDGSFFREPACTGLVLWGVLAVGTMRREGLSWLSPHSLLLRALVMRTK